MKIAVIGAEGFIGSRLVETLHLAREHTVVPIGRTPASLARATRFDLEKRTADASDPRALREALRGCDAVVHAAAPRTDREFERLPATLCTTAAAVGIRRLVFLSSSRVHGLVPEAGSNEHSPLHTSGAPDEVARRIMAERIFFQHCKRLKLEGIALRPTLVYGPRSSWFFQLTRDLREGRAGWFGEGRGIFNGLYVDNLVSAIFSALAAPAAATGKPYLVGDAETVTWREFYLATAHLLGASPRRIANVTELPPESVTPRAPLQRLARSAGVKAVAPAVPTGVRRLAKFFLVEEPAPPDAWTSRAALVPSLTHDLALQQQCRWRFPLQRATRALGFQPPVAFAEALKRSVSWVAFAEGEPPRSSASALPESAVASNRLDVPDRG